MTNVVPCNECGNDFAANKKQLWRKSKGRNVFCCRRCQDLWCSRHLSIHDPLKLVKGKRGPVRGPCPICGERFRSYHAKTYCSMDCYAKSDQMRDMLRAHREKRTKESGGIQPFSCLNCHKEVLASRPVSTRKRKFCSQSCYREYLAGRFDRWIADPQSISLPQNYDEFLLQEELPCLVEGCEWVGKYLSFHCNVAHGITAEQLKELAGFNRKTGLVSRDLHDKMSARQQQWANGQPPPVPPQNTDGVKRQPARPEGREHARKAMILMHGAVSDRVKACRECGREIKQPLNGQRLYCSLQCRSAFYASYSVRLICGMCGAEFDGTANQERSAKRGGMICCSLKCRNTFVASHPRR